MDLNPKNVIVWGFKFEKRYCTHSHIHEGFYRALNYLYPGKTHWLDDTDEIINFKDSLVITEHEAAKRGMPLDPSNFYIIHGLVNDQDLKNRMTGIPYKLGWNVFHDFSHGNTARWNCENQAQLDDYKEFLKGLKPGPPKDSELDLNRIQIRQDFYYYPQEANMDFRWATDILPHEIEENKKLAKISNPDSKVINYVGTTWFVNSKELSEFDHACKENGIEFKPVGAGQRGVVTLEENQQLVRDSYFSPAILGSHHLVEGYACCRIFKNISYGCMGVTNSKRVNDIFQNKLIFDDDPYRLFYTAKERLQDTKIEQVHELMDLVATQHTYIQRLESIMKVVRLVMETT